MDLKIAKVDRKKSPPTISHLYGPISIFFKREGVLPDNILLSIDDWLEISSMISGNEGAKPSTYRGISLIPYYDEEVE